MPNQSLDLHELFQQILLEAHAAWRYRWHALIVAWCVMIVGALLVFSLPSKYDANAQVYADTNALTNPLLRGIAVQPDLNGRLDVITRTLLARPNLETVADKTGLSLRATTPADKDALLEKLGASVKIKDAGAKNLYNISYSDPDPKMAQKVVQAFIDILMNDTVGENNASTASAQNFLQQQVNDYNNRLNAAEKKLAEFKKDNVGNLPGPDGSDYSTRLQVAEARLQELESASALVPSGGPVATVRRGNPQLDALDQQIAAYQQKLNALLLKYTDVYPDVVSTKRELGVLESRRAALAANPGSGGAVEHVRRSGGGALAGQIAAQKQQIADLKRNADKITDAQVKLQQLTRNYDVTKKQYDELVARLNTAQLSQDASQTGNNLKFRVISPPIVPLLPSGPHRGLMLLAVFVVALGIGGVFGFFLHKIKPVFLSLKSLREFGDFPVIGTFSLIATHTRRDARRREVVGFCTGLGLLAIVLVLGLAFSGPLAHAMQHVFALGAT
ncbi:MAG TPA: XrtA system polysaccharide chain length determinant [Rhodanobacteraceae bacterium]